MSQLNCFILNWNVIGLNSQAKQDNVKLLVDQMKATVVCLQETKMEMVSDSVITQSLGSALCRNLLSSLQLEREEASFWPATTTFSQSHMLS